MTTDLIPISSKDFDGKLATLIQDVHQHLPRSHAVNDDIAKITRVVQSIATYLYDRSRSSHSREDIDIMLDYLAMKIRSWKEAL
ncbi:MAG: hypothetical protein NZL83_01450 [Candidatus Absconditabacterales bacterium]|nr:hypothetical protein [Candidatus Absconditabacterales bacterium]